MRGLEIRVAYARGKILATIDPDEGALQRQIAAFDAEMLGGDEAFSDAAIPVMFADEAELSLAWVNGHRKARGLQPIRPPDRLLSAWCVAVRDQAVRAVQRVALDDGGVTR